MVALSTEPFSWRIALMSGVEEQAVRWLWPGRIALGKLNMLIGDPGLGKSFVTCDLAARLSTGRAWPDGAANGEAGMTLLLNAEDDAADTIKPRLRAAGADMDKIAVMPAVDRGRLFSLAKHIDALARNVALLPDLKLIVVDPVSAFLSGIDSHKNTDVREALAPLSALAESSGAAILAVTHLNKGAGQAVYRATGSLAFTAASRSVWAVAKDKDHRDRRLFLPVKNNLGNDKTGLAYSINGYSYPPFVEWEPNPVEADIDNVLNAEAQRAAPPRASVTDEADSWLASFLDGGERPSREVYEAGEAVGFSRGQLKRARQRVGVAVRREGMPARSIWVMPGNEPGDSGPLDQSAPVPRTVSQQDQQNRQVGPAAPLGPASPLEGARGKRGSTGRNPEAHPAAAPVEATVSDAPVAPVPSTESAVPSYRLKAKSFFESETP